MPRIYLYIKNIMRRQDKRKNIEQANLMLEQSYLKSKGLLKEDENMEQDKMYELIEKASNLLEKYGKDADGDIHEVHDKLTLLLDDKNLSDKDKNEINSIHKEMDELIDNSDY